MKKSSAIDYFLYLTAKAITSVIRFIPIGFSIFVIRLIGALVFYVLRKKRSIAYKNLRIAFPQYSPKKINKIIKQTFMNCAQHCIEVAYLPWMDERYIKRFMEFEGWDETLNTINNKKGSIVLFLHEGSFEVGNIVLSQLLKGCKYAVLTRLQSKISTLSGLLNEYRARAHCDIITLSNSLRPLVEYLRNGDVLAMSGDHGAQGGIFVDFFGRPALTPTGALKLALKLDANLIVGFIKKKGGAHHKISLSPYKLVKTRDTNKDLKTNLENINRRFEEYIRESPGEYLWFFKRWKYSPQRNILVLSDGKPGHLKQSLAVLDLIKSLPYQIKSNIVEIRFKNNFQKIAFHICAFFFSKNCQGCMGCFLRLFNSFDYHKLLSEYYDIVISCGSSLAMLNRLVAFENMAKSIAVMKPGMFSLKRFDLIIIPEHDNVLKSNNVALIKGALSKELGKDKNQLGTVVSDYELENPPLSSPVIGVLLGGSNKYLSLDIGTASEAVRTLDGITENLSSHILVSTSRRTSKDIEGFLKDNLSKNPRCRMLIIANEYNPQGSLEAILHLSDILVVTGDSISMISEAINSGKHVIVLKLKRKKSHFLSKHERFISNLERDGYIYTASKDDLADKLTYVWNYRPSIKKIADKEIILEKLKKIL